MLLETMNIVNLRNFSAGTWLRYSNAVSVGGVVNASPGNSALTFVLKDSGRPFQLDSSVKCLRIPVSTSFDKEVDMLSASPDIVEYELTVRNSHVS